MILIGFSSGFHISRKLVNHPLEVIRIQFPQLPVFFHGKPDISKPSVQKGAFLFRRAALTPVSIILISLIYISIICGKILALRTSIFLRSGQQVFCIPDCQILAFRTANFLRSRRIINCRFYPDAFYEVLHIYHRWTVAALSVPFDQADAMYTVKLPEKLCDRCV